LSTSLNIIKEKGKLGIHLC